MSTFELRITVPDLVALTAGLRGVADRLRNWRPIWAATVPVFFAHMAREFVSQGAADGSPWAPLTPRYASEKAQHFPGQGLLVRSGAFRASLTEGPGTPGTVVNIGDTSVEMGSTVLEGALAQRGTGRETARPALRLTREFREEIFGAMRQQVEIAWAARRSEGGLIAA